MIQSKKVVGEAFSLELAYKDYVLTGASLKIGKRTITIELEELAQLATFLQAELLLPKTSPEEQKQLQKQYDAYMKQGLSSPENPLGEHKVTATVDPLANRTARINDVEVVDLSSQIRATKPQIRMPDSAN